MSGHILVVDDEKNIRKTLRSALMEEGYRVTEAENGKTALSLIKEKRPDVILLDIWMEGLDGIETLKMIKKDDPYASVVMMSGHGNIETAVKATKLGAFDFIEKPLSLEKILLVIKNLLSVHLLQEENKLLRAQVQKRFQIVMGSSQMESLCKQIRVAAPTNSWMLITGENGTGKELVARSIHEQSQRARRPFIEVNCAAIPEELIESELFGHEKGAFTGATASKRGKFELAHEGTLFLDEIADMSLKTQAKILRVLQEQKFERVGGNQMFQVDVRVIGATNKSLLEEIKEGRFRNDLYYRLNVIPLHVPALRERPEDIPVLIEYFLRQMAQESGKKIKMITKEAVRVLKAYEWPGNVRELKNIVERLFIMTIMNEITVHDIPESIREWEDRNKINQMKVGSHYRRAKIKFEKAYLEKKLKEFEGNISKTARAIGMERSNLHRKMRAYRIEV